jgi:hypothetical protein
MTVFRMQAEAWSAHLPDIGVETFQEVIEE